MKIISFNVTKQCNLYCSHCYRDSSSNVDLRNELNTDEVKKMFYDIKRVGFNMLKLSGGEPLLRNDIFEIAKYSSDLGLYTCLGTNATLITKDNINKLKNANIKSIAVSIDSTNKNLHDDFRGRLGSFDRALRGIDLCLKNNIKVQVNTTISKINKDEINELLDFSKEIGASSVHVLFLVQTGRGTNLNNLYLSHEEYEKAIIEVLNYESDLFIKPTCAPQSTTIAKKLNLDPRVKKGCIAGTSYCSIVYNGDVNICPYANITAGNVRKNSFYDIWNDSEVFKNLRDLSKLKGKCKKCKSNNICGGCRARAYSMTGDYLEYDEYCLI